MFKLINCLGGSAIFTVVATSVDEAKKKVVSMWEYFPETIEYLGLDESYYDYGFFKF